jgi:flagellar biosynthesis protein FlhB
VADNGGQEKTEQPTSKRRKDARKEGNVFQSKDIATVVMLLGIFFDAAADAVYIPQYTGLYEVCD